MILCCWTDLFALYVQCTISQLFTLQLFQSYRPYDHKVGERQLVLATELSHDQQHYVAHNKFYEQVQHSFKSENKGGGRGRGRGGSICVCVHLGYSNF